MQMSVPTAITVSSSNSRSNVATHLRCGAIFKDNFNSTIFKVVFTNLFKATNAKNAETVNADVSANVQQLICLC